MREKEELLAKAQYFVDCKYVARADERQKSMGLAYVEAERQDLAREIANFAMSFLSALPSPELPAGGATHMRRPEYITAWFYDLKATWPKWLVDKYTNTMPVPDEMVGRYATAIDGEFWRWLDAEKFNELYVPVVPSTDGNTP